VRYRGSLLVDHINPPDGQAAFFAELLAIREDPKVRGLALRRAGDRDLAEDALQEAWYAVAQVRDPGRIENLRAYFCRTLINKVYDLRGHQEPALVEDFESLAESQQGAAGCTPAPPRPVPDLVSTRLLTRIWLDRLNARRESLTKAVPGRSSDPSRYRTLIVSVAEQVLRAIVDGGVSDADSNQALRAAYSQWFGEKADAANNVHQRFSRARGDVRDVLAAIVHRDELDP
jgi:DNA-directed RNA polymerase specialized sigma24 family protein